MFTGLHGPKKRGTEEIITEALKWCLYVCDHPGTSGAGVAKAFKVSPSSVNRAWALLRRLGMEIDYPNNKAGFVIKNWGVFNEKSVHKILEKK